MHCKYLTLSPKALYGTNGGTYSARFFRPVMRVIIPFWDNLFVLKNTLYIQVTSYQLLPNINLVLNKLLYKMAFFSMYFSGFIPSICLLVYKIQWNCPGINCSLDCGFMIITSAFLLYRSTLVFNFLLTYPCSHLTFFCVLIQGRLSDIYGRKQLLLVSLLGAALSYFLMALPTTLLFLALSRIPIGEIHIIYIVTLIDRAL